MKKILIVDDNNSNRILLRTLLEEYGEDNGLKLDIREAVNGLEAVAAAQKEHFSLILMDIMMPYMDGIEATKRIHALDSKAMIIAVSAVDDGERQQQILINGAEDYIAKPINADIFTARLGNYFSLIASRHSEGRKFNPEAANLFTQETFSRKILFYVQNEDDLAQFWEYYLVDSNIRCESLSDAIRTVYALASIGLKMGVHLQIIVEKCPENMYITLVGVNEIDAKIIKLVMSKNPSVTDYKMGVEKFCIRLPYHCEDPVLSTLPAVQETIVVDVAHPSVTDTNVSMATYTSVQGEKQVYNYMESEDMEDLKEYVGKLNSLMLIVGGEIERHEVDEISDNLQRISRISSGYIESYTIGRALASMGHVIRDHSNLFITKSNDLAPMCAAFGRDLGKWIQLIFVEGTTSVNYMDDTIVANAQMIESMLTMDDANSSDAAENLDDIFDF